AAPGVVGDGVLVQLDRDRHAEVRGQVGGLAQVCRRDLEVRLAGGAAAARRAPPADTPADLAGRVVGRDADARVDQVGADPGRGVDRLLQALPVLRRHARAGEAAAPAQRGAGHARVVQLAAQLAHLGLGAPDPLAQADLDPLEAGLADLPEVRPAHLLGRD